MKTLNEVITVMDHVEFCCTNCKLQFDCDEVECFLEDALHYLKTIETTENLYHDAVNELSKWKDEDWKDRCLPLTWEELKQMFHRPVWIETTAKKGWNIIVSIDSADMQVIHTAHRGPKLSGFSKADLGKTWQAYRKERS